MEMFALIHLKSAHNKTDHTVTNSCIFIQERDLFYAGILAVQKATATALTDENTALFTNQMANTIPVR